ncbi:MAG: hypothetical protein ACSHWY_01185 [Octadecabacter sp.]
MIRAKEAWGNDVPDVVKAIVAACDAPNSSQNKVAKRLGYSTAVVSQIISKKYPGDLQGIAQRVRMILMGSTVECPVDGTIPETTCVEWKNNAKTLTSSNPTVVKMFRQCRKCPEYTGVKPDV